MYIIITKPIRLNTHTPKLCQPNTLIEKPPHKVQQQHSHAGAIKSQYPHHRDTTSKTLHQKSAPLPQTKSRVPTPFVEKATRNFMPAQTPPPRQQFNLIHYLLHFNDSIRKNNIIPRSP
jgi:hypothetical protein